MVIQKKRTRKGTIKKTSIPWRGEIWLVKFPPAKEDRKPIHPCWVISDNIQNEYGK